VVRSLETLIPVAEGAIGRVYRTRDAKTGELLAVKRLHFDSPAHIERLQREAEAQKRLDHRGICRVFGLEKDEDGHWQLLMEFVDGSTLAAELERLSLAQRIDMLQGVCEAVEHAHQHGILHRDLKPANVLLRRTGSQWHPVVADFGLARDSEDPALTTTGEILGSPAYMAPEQARGDRAAIGPHSDIFSIGCMLYEALTGHPPFEGATVSDSLNRLLNSEADHPRTLNPHAPEPLCQVALQCLEHLPARRYLSAAAVAADLQRWSRHETVQARRYTRLYRFRRAILRRPVESSAAGLAAIALLIFTAWGVDTARTASLREASAATLGTALADVSRRMTIARLAPAHDIGDDRDGLRADLQRLEAGQAEEASTSDLLRAALASGYLEIGDLARAETEAARALKLRDTPATRAVRARTLLARYANTAAALMDLPSDQRDERIKIARETYLEPAQALIQRLSGSVREPTEALARLDILERRFEQAERRIANLQRAYPQDYTPELLAGALEMMRAEQALEHSERERAAQLFESAQAQFEAITEIGRSDPRPRLQACRAGRGVLRATLDQGGAFPDSLDGVSPGCTELEVIDPGNPDIHAERAAAWSTLAEAFDGVNASEQARRALRAGLTAARTALELSASHQQGLEQLARLNLRLAGLEPEPWTRAQEHFDAAAQAADHLQAVRPDYPVGRLLTALIERNRARHLALHDQPDQARKALGRAQTAFEDVLEQTPESVVALSGAALNAVFHFYEYRPRDPDLAVHWMERSIELLRRALVLDPDNIDLLFDQGANHGDLWYYLLVTPESQTRRSGDELLTTAMRLLGRLRELAPQHPRGYTHPIMILLSGADYRIDHALDASTELDLALELQAAAMQAGVTLDRDIPAWIQQVRVRNVLAQGGDAAPVFESAFATLGETDVDPSDRFYLELNRLELIGLYQRWLRQTGQTPMAGLFGEAHSALQDLLDNDRRQAGVLCAGGRVLLEQVLTATNRTGFQDRPTLDRALALFEECLDTDGDFQARYGSDVDQVRELLAAATRSHP